MTGLGSQKVKKLVILGEIISFIFTNYLLLMCMYVNKELEVIV
jgi:hypothetical protein